eukprot:gene8916-12024_t
MGASGSVITLAQLTPEQVGELVANLGAVYVEYKNILISNAISGEVIASLSETEFAGLLNDLAIKNVVHQKVLISHFKKLKGSGQDQSSGTNKSSNQADDDCCKFFALPSDFEVGEVVTKTPRSIMSTLFEIQGIAVDPTDLDPAVEKIAKAVGPGFGDGINKFDCFINYRVASDADLAEKLYLYLKTKNIHAFLDKKCLKNGEKWKDGFLTGLKNSKCFVAIISRKALDRVRDETDNHTWDNVLLEYETALAIKGVTNNKKYIVPLHVGQCEKGVLTKFIDFSSGLYPDSILPIKKDPVVAAPAAVNKPKVVVKAVAVQPADSNEDIEIAPAEENVLEEPPEGGILCGTCAQPVKLQTDVLPPGIAWSCDFPGHEGPNEYTSEDPIYGCDNCLECQWAVCETCFNNIQQSAAAISAQENENEMAVDQPEGTRSKYNDNYYCDVKKVTFRSAEHGLMMIVSFSERGDGSEGPIQEPSTSRISIGETEIEASESQIFIRDYYQIQGDLHFFIPTTMQNEFFTEKVGFMYGASGYTEALISVPGSTYCNNQFPVCKNNHIMPVSAYNEGNYRAGYVCNTCREAKTGFRWFCGDCTDDFCFSCVPLQAMKPVCLNGHPMDRLTTKPAHYSSANCDVCRRKGLQHDCEFYHCNEGCNYDLCIGCASLQIAQTMVQEEA